MSDSKIIPAVVLSLGLIAGAATFGYFYHSAQLQAASRDTLSVTGSAKTHVVSDQAKIVLNISRIAPESALVAGYASVAHDLNLATALLRQAGLPEAAVTASPVSMSQMYEPNPGPEVRYQLNQTVTVQDGDVNRMAKIAQDIPSLAAQGALVSVQSLEYYYSKLPDLRVSLLTDAVKDAKARAEMIAAGTGRTVGNVQAASSGVVQVMAPNSVDVSDYGTYDTSSIEKDIMVTVKASFRLE